MNKRLLSVVLLLTCGPGMTGLLSAQVLVSSHTNVINGLVFPTCVTHMLVPSQANLYVGAEASCQLTANTAVVASWSCSDRSNAVCSPPAPVNVIQGGDYQTEANHSLHFALLAAACTENNVLVACYYDPFTYGFPLFGPPFPRNVTDSDQILPRGGESFWFSVTNPPSDLFLIGSSTETKFVSTLITPFKPHYKANDIQQFVLSASQDAIWTFIGSGGTTTPTAPPPNGAEATILQFNAPNTVPVQQVNTLQACKVDQSHGSDCMTQQIIVDVLKVSIPPGDTTEIPLPDNPTELLGGAQAFYKATVTLGAEDLPPGQPVHWTENDPSGLNLITINPTSGFVTVQPQSVFQGGTFIVTVQATSDFDPSVAVSAPFTIRIPTATVQMTTIPSPGLNDTSTVFRADAGRTFHFAANVTGPSNPQNRNITNWDQVFVPSPFDFSEPGVVLLDPNNPNVMDYQITSPPPKGNFIGTTIRACVGGRLDALSGGLTGAQCAQFPMTFSAPVFPTSPPQTINSGESTLITIKGTGFGAAPTLGFSDPTVTFTPGTVSGPDANGVTTVTGTMTAAPVPAPIPFSDKIIPVTITSSLPPPSIPVTQNVFVVPVKTTPAVTPVNPTLLVSQTQQFTPSLGCQTAGGQTCTVPQIPTCSMFTGPGTMSAGCLYTAPASLAAQTQARGSVCFTFGHNCTTFPINLVPISVAVSPATAALNSGQSQLFQATVTNAPNNNQGVNWSINPAVGAITAAGLYTAPAAVTTAQSISVTACSQVDPTQCSSATVTLVPPDFALSTAQSTGLSAPGFQNGFSLTVAAVGGFTGNVTLSATLPAGIGMISVFSPTTITGSGSSVATFPVSASSPVGTYPVTITATSGGLVHSVQITVTVVQPSIDLTVGPAQTSAAGQTVTFTFTAMNNNFFGSIGVSETGIPPGSTITPTPWGGNGNGTLVFTTPAGLASGTYSITFTATGGGVVTSGSSSLNVNLTKSASTTLTIPDPPPPPPDPGGGGCTGRPRCIPQ